MTESKQIANKIKRYKEILKQMRYLRKEKGEILSYLDRATRGEEYRKKDTFTNIDRIEKEIK